MVPQDLEEVYVLKIRIKYSKLGNLRFIGHLDVMRYFQKEIRRAGLDVSYSKGYSPHQIISFAAPLAMGITSDGEYFDGEFESVTTSREMIDALNAVSVDEMKVTECVLLPDDAKNSMSVVSASDYVISFLDKAGTEERHNILDSVESFMSQDQIIILKKTKKSEREENIKPGIMTCELRDDQIYMLCCQPEVNTTSSRSSSCRLSARMRMSVTTSSIIIFTDWRRTWMALMEI